MQLSQIDTSKTPSLSELFGLEADGSVNIRDSYLAALCNEMRKVLPVLIEVNEDEADVSAAIGIIGRAAAAFQRVIDELS